MSRQTVERETRQRFILDAARALFAERGIENATMDDIARAAEYTRRTLYAYFPSRDDICMRIHLEDLEERWDRQKRAVAGAVGGPARLVAWGETLYGFWKERPHSMRLEQYWDFHGVQPGKISAGVFARFEALNDELADGLRGIFREGITDGSLRGDLDVDVCISQFLYSLRAVLGRALSPSYSFVDIDPDRYVQQFLELFCRGVRNVRNKGGKTR